MKKHQNIDWFKEWFNSPYYHLLYQHRSNSEAEEFIKNLYAHFESRHLSRVLDLACGRGRHAKQLSELGFDVVGIDLSEKNIETANQLANERLHFEVGDMRNIPFSNEFDVVMNLFTSFGYFKKESDNGLVIQSISNALKPNGYLVLDYLNAEKLLGNMVEEDVIHRDGIQFNIRKKISESFVKKEISFEDKGQHFKYHEFVRLFHLEDFKKFFEQYQLHIVSTFGDYNLNPYQKQDSDRLILIARKQ